VRALVAAQLALLVVLGLVTVAAFPVWALVDELAHFDYAQTVAEEGRLPFLGRDTVDDATQELGDGPVREGLTRQSYEAFQPPLQYVVAAPVVLVLGDGLAAVRALRGLGLVALLVSAWLVWLLARRAAPRAPLVPCALGLAALLVPAVVVRTVTFSNAALELPLALGAVVALWDGRRLLGAVLLGLGLLTRLEVVMFLPLLAASAPLLLAVPAAMLAPWVASNLARYGAPTAGEVVRDMQAGLLGDDVTPSRLLNAPLPEEWWVEFLSTAKRRLRDVAMALAFLGPLALAVRRPPPARAWLFLVAPLATGLVLVAAGSVVGDWDFFYPRYLHAALPGYAVFAGLLVGPRTAAAVTAVLVVVWARLATVTPFTP
jgi:hypothetical protein